MLNTKKLTNAIQLALFVGAASLVAGSAFAQDQNTQEDAQTLDRIEVTGSRIRSADVETAQPVFSISRQQLEAQGVVSVADVLQNMAVAGSPPISRSEPLASGESVGGQYIDLRNLGANRTLVLVNGKRLPITTSGLQDISAIPNIMVERIDVLKDGASSVYGSDAIAGVINIITRRNYNGAEAEVYYGQQSRGDGTKERVSGVFGVAGERGFVTVGAEYRKEGEVWARDRWFSKDSFPGFPQLSTTVVGQWGNWRPVGSTGAWMAPNRGSSALGAANFHPQTSADTSVPADQMHLINPLSARTLFLSGGYDISENVRWNAEAGYSNRVADRQVAGYPTQSTAIGAPMAADSYFNPIGTGPVNWRRRGWEVPRSSESDLTSWRFATSIEGTAQLPGERYLDWEAGYSYADNKLAITSTGNFHIPNTRAAVGPSFLNSQGQIQCGTATAPIPFTQCVPWNPFAGFGTGAVANSLDDPNVQRFLFPTEQSLGNTSTAIYFATVSGNLFSLPAGDLTYAAGYESRTEKGAFAPDALAQSGSSTNLAAGPTSGRYKVNEFFGELNIPVLADVAFAKELTFNLASRYSDYDTFGDTTNSKFGVKWKPIDDLLVRATWAQGFRAPTISNLYGGGSQTFTTGFRDPCDSVFGDARGSARCLQDVPANYRQLQQGFVPTASVAAQTPVPFTSGSNPSLLPEQSRSWTAGLVYSPSYVQGLDIALDWWKIRIDDTMVSDSPNEILSDCYVAGIESRCAMFSRDPQLHIVNDLTYGLRNAGYSLVEGWDLSVGYRIPTDAYGNFSINSDSSYFSRYESKSTNDPTTPISQSVSFGSTFRLRSNLVLGWEYKNIGLTWSARYYSSMKEECFFDEYCNIPNYASPATRGQVIPHQRWGSTTFNDVQFRIKAPWNGAWTIGVNNVFDRFGPIGFSQPSSNFAYYGGFDIGRFWYFKYSQKF